MLRYIEEGDGRPLVLVHAGIADKRMWQPQVERFARRWRVICPDLRGFGESPHDDAPYRHAWDLAVLLDALEVTDGVVVGASMGGAACIDLALARPDLVGVLVLVGSVYEGFRFHEEALFAEWRRLDEVYQTGDLDAAARLETGIWLSHEADSGVMRLVVDMVRRSYTFDEVGQAEGPDARLEDLSVPTLVIVGENDRVDIRRAAGELRERVPGATSVDVPGAAHLPSLEQPETFNEQLASFMEEHAEPH